MNKRLNIIVGHYGSGKTNFSVNMALRQAKQGERIAIVDMDIVNPYFRTADFSKLLTDNKIRVILPQFALSNLDLPVLPAEIFSIFNDSGEKVIIDLGGDDAGATALGLIRERIESEDYDMFYIFNAYRLSTNTPEAAAEVLREIESVSGLKASFLVNCSNLGMETTPLDIIRTGDYANRLKELTSLPLAYTCIYDRIYAKTYEQVENPLSLELLVKQVWQ